jgi:hypothetical protein
LGKKSLFWAFVIIGLLLLILLDRSNWSTVTQWREDQSTNLWLGYTQSPLDMPVGLISSVDLPNPNGMVLLSIFLSRLPNLWYVSLAIGLIQGGLILWIAWLLFKREFLFFIICLPALASVALRATSVEFWNQWIITSVNLLFWGLWITYLRNPTVLKIPLLFLPLLLAPALYLAGLVNAGLFLVFILAGMRVAPPRGNRQLRILSMGISLACIILAAWLTWIPYFQATAGFTFPGSHPTLAEVRDRLATALLSGIRFPFWNVALWSKNLVGLFYQSSISILPASTIQLFRITRLFVFLQAILLLPALLLGFLHRDAGSGPSPGIFRNGYKFQGYVLLAGLGFVILAYMLSPLLGGYIWAEGERMDQQIQFLPFLLFSWFALPCILRLPRVARIATQGFSITVAAGFVLAGVISGFQIVDAHLQYRGDFLSEADVPLRDKMQAVDFIARDWLSTSQENSVPVYYDLGGGTWDWVTYSGKRMERWYPAPFTMGRGLDFELLRVYGLHNSQEGIQERSSASARYIVTYAFLEEPHYPGVIMTHYRIGRLRVSVVQQRVIQ